MWIILLRVISSPIVHLFHCSDLHMRAWANGSLSGDAPYHIVSATEGIIIMNLWIFSVWSSCIEFLIGFSGWKAFLMQVNVQITFLLMECFLSFISMAAVIHRDHAPDAKLYCNSCHVFLNFISKWCSSSAQYELFRIPGLSAFLQTGTHSNQVPFFKVEISW